MNSCIKALEEGLEISYNKIVSLVCLEYGAGRRYVKEIIDDLIIVGKLKLEGDVLSFIPEA